MKEGKRGICCHESAYFSFGHFSTNDIIKLHHLYIQPFIH